jgi:hypothetical protein
VVFFTLISAEYFFHDLTDPHQSSGRISERLFLDIQRDIISLLYDSNINHKT